MSDEERNAARDEVVRAVSGPGRSRQLIEIAIGVAALVIGMIDAAFQKEPGDPLWILPTTGALVGMILFLHGLMPLLSSMRPGTRHGSVLPALGYKTFVAWRYLMVNPPRVGVAVYAMIGAGIAGAIGFGLLGVVMDVSPGQLTHPVVIVQWLCGMFAFGVIWVGMMRFSRPARIVVIAGVAIVELCIVAVHLLVHDKLPFVSLEFTDPQQIGQGISIVMLIAGAVAFISLVSGMLRSVFTFFTTVPIVGVWIGTAALVIVLSVMSGFESDLRQKILGSNAHLQVTREEGDFNEWRAIKARLDHMPGVVASTPYAVSEVVVAANNNGANCIIKGIDPATVGNVTDLVNDLEDRDAIKRLEPLVDDAYDRVIQQRPKPATPAKPDDEDAPPADMPAAGDPIDFGKPSTAPLPPPTPAPAPPPTSPTTRSGSGLGSDHPPDAVRSTNDDTRLEPPPSDLPVRATDVLDSSLSRRTQSLPGILVGRELVKQTHLYSGEEVRIVSPLSDPSNPDATGTPIPFNRDYRVAGVFYTGMYEYDLKYVYVSLESLQVFLDRGDAVDGIEIRITDPDDTDEYVSKISAELGPAYRVQDWQQLNRSLFTALKLEKIAMFLVLGIVILVASFSIVGNLIMVVVEKAKEIALLKTLGASDMGVMQLFAVQGLLIGCIGTLIGVATGLAGCWFGQRYGLPLDPNVYYIDRLPIHIDSSSVSAAALAGVLVSLAATLYPAMLAARVRPAAGMRH